MDNGLPCDDCGGPTYMHCHLNDVPTLCRDCAAEWDNRRAELEEVQHQEEMRELERMEMEEHFRRHPHG